MNMVTDIIDFNSTATADLVEGRYDEAISLFRIALRKTRQLLGQIPAALQHAQVNALDAPDAVKYPIVYCVSLTDSKKCFTEGDVAGFKFFNRVFAVKNATTPKDHDILALIILFNLSVAHHKKGISTGSSKELVAAMKYYTMTSELIHHLSQQSKLDSILLLLMLAVWNNVGNIHLHFLDVTEAVKYFTRIGKLLARFDASFFQKEDYDFFRANVLISLQWATLIAPAA